jgi:hypothetical protein
MKSRYPNRRSPSAATPAIPEPLASPLESAVVFSEGLAGAIGTSAGKAPTFADPMTVRVGSNFAALP